MRSLIPRFTHPPYVRPTAAIALRRDPAPSRNGLQAAAAVADAAVPGAVPRGPALVLVGVGLYLAAGRCPPRASDRGIAELREKVKNRPEFMVTLVSVEGASPDLAEAVRSALALPLPMSSLDLDLDGRARTGRSWMPCARS
jgi:cell division protein FtsQ